MAKQKRLLKDKLRTEQKSLEAKRRYEAEAQVLALAILKKETTLNLDTPMPYHAKKILYGNNMPKGLR